MKKYLGYAPKVRKVHYVGGVSTDSSRFVVHNASINNLQRGVLERVFYIKTASGFQEPPKPAPGVINQVLRPFKDFILHRLRGSTPIDIFDFPKLYWGRQQTRYYNAALSLARRGVRKSDADCIIFGKGEKTNILTKGKDAVMRIVTPRKPEYNVAVGRYLKPVEKKLYKAVDAYFGDATIIKGLNAQETARCIERKWLRYRKPAAVGLDACRFDQHVSVDMLKWEHSVYTGIYRESPELTKLLSWQLSNNCKGYCKDGKLKYTTVGGRASGDMNTGLGNCLIMTAMVDAYCRSIGLRKFSVANNGDDCVVFMERSWVDRFNAGLVEFFLKLGFNMKMEPPVFVLEQISFCQTNPVWSQGGYVMVRDPRVCISKDALSLTPIAVRSAYEKWIAAVGIGGLSLSGGIPVLQEFYKSFLLASRGRAPAKLDQTQLGGWYHMTRGMERKTSPISPRARYSFYLAFDIYPDMQIEIERYFMAHVPYYRPPRHLAVIPPALWWV